VASLADYIEQYLRKLVDQAVDGKVEFQRCELAERFGCVPSQISYVLETRFTRERGYLVESRRGGGGYVRIVRLTLGSHEHLLRMVAEEIGDGIGQEASEHYIVRLMEEGVITEREGRMMKAAIDRNTLRVPLPQRDHIRASIMRAMILAILSYRG